MAVERLYQMIDNFVYLYHTNEFIVIPSFADSVTDNLQANFSSETPLLRSAPIYSYQSSGPRSIQVEFNLQREMMWEINYQTSNVKTDLNNDYVDYMIKAIQAAALPEYEMALKMVNPPVLALKLSDDIFIKGVVTGQVGVTYNYPIISGYNPDGTPNDKINRYSSVRIGFGINEVEPYQASDVMKSGSFRGVPEKLGGYVFGSSIESISSNTASSSIGGRVKTCMVK